ncbi:glutathione S-transferase family protein [Acinetobacter rudis]|uniref:Glutathione S-transferase n=1 Tax=Acinetobacter rudis TaxID=632955 RepID=A0AAW8J878_9GAMM|nr:glutathione S-transferase [Acinetobacter rudis]MDQ8936361.1 glutathione S-transferase [Acinetobacter rudis]MDQ8953416.1 glutathione S-transferase [Acinetobacter rudis]MDQ9018622.1 glutathione S-transferase [Acinetobacter rudis]
MKLYDLELSGNCYKVRLFAALANIDLTLTSVDFLAGEHKSADLLKLNPFGELPILDDNGFILRDSQAILIYLAGKYAGEAWWPSSPQLQAEVSQWLFVAANEIQHGPCAARLVDLFHYSLDKQIALTKSKHILDLINTHLAQHSWLAINRPTIADIAIYPYVALAHEGAIDLSPYAHIQAWMQRIENLPNYIPMPGL